VNFFQTEKTIVGYLKQCLNICHVQGVPDYWFILTEGPSHVKDDRPGLPGAAAFVWYGGHRVKFSDGCCGQITQTYHVAVMTKNYCKIATGEIAREKHGEVVSNLLCCMSKLCDNSLCDSLKLVNSPQFPIPMEDNGVVTTYFSYEIDTLIVCSE
jgi:hypothetical protein